MGPWRRTAKLSTLTSSKLTRHPLLPLRGRRCHAKLGECEHSPWDEGLEAGRHASPQNVALSFQALIRPSLTRRPPSPAKRQKGRRALFGETLVEEGLQLREVRGHQAGRRRG